MSARAVTPDIVDRGAGVVGASSAQHEYIDPLCGFCRRAENIDEIWVSGMRIDVRRDCEQARTAIPMPPLNTRVTAR
jgi:hypothetical protein